MGREPLRETRNWLSDSRRWDGFEPRDDDIFVVTPAKSGTTWTQQILASLLWPAGGPPDIGWSMSPWLDSRLHPLDETMARLDAMEHRRIIKTHTPPDSFLVEPRCRYVAVSRDPADALVSWHNHRGAMRQFVTDYLDSMAEADGVETAPTFEPGNFHALLDEFIALRFDPVSHLAAWSPLLGEDHVLLVHYNDLLTDLDGQMRRIAAFCDIDVPAADWESAVDRCRFDNMKADYAATELMDVGFEGGADAFFHQGRRGRGRQELDPSVLDRLDASVQAGLDAASAAWLASGSLATGTTPGTR